MYFCNILRRYDKELAGSSSDDDSAKKPAVSEDFGAAGIGGGGIADHLGKAQKKTMDMYRPCFPMPHPPAPLLTRLLQVVVHAAIACPCW